MKGAEANHARADTRPGTGNAMSFAGRGAGKRRERRERKPAKPLDSERLHALALHYVGRYATTRHKLATYLSRKLRERGWEGERPADIEALVERFAELGYVDDAAFARTKAEGLTRRGYGKQRVGQALYQAGIAENDGEDARAHAADHRWQAAETFAAKKRIGPHAETPADPDKRRRQLAQFLRAGHDYEVARRYVYAQPGEVVEVE